MTDEELKELVAGLAVAQKQTDEQIAALSVAQKQTDEQIAALSVAQKQTDEQMRKTDEQINRVDKQLEKVTAKLDKVAAKIDKVAEIVDGVGKNQGFVAEEFFFNSLADHPHLGEIRFDNISSNLKIKQGRLEEEYDIVMTNGNSIGIIEVKYKAHENDLEKIRRKLRNFKTLCPVYERYNVYGAIASFCYYEKAKEKALESGLFVLQRNGNVIHTDCGEKVLIL